MSVEQFMLRFDEADVDQKGYLTREQFRELFPEVMSGDRDRETADIYFSGIDIDGDDMLTREEFREFVEAGIRKDKRYAIKMQFRAFDSDRNRALDAEEVERLSAFHQRHLTDKEIGDLLEARTGSRTGTLTFAQVLELLTSEVVDEDVDPYENNLKETPAEEAK